MARRVSKTRRVNREFISGDNNPKQVKNIIDNNPKQVKNILDNNPKQVKNIIRGYN